MNDDHLEDEDRRLRAYLGPLGKMIHVGQYFFVWKEGGQIGTYDSLEEAREALRAQPCLQQSS
jgi:hypothetical protein